ncbi:MAG: prolyl oligopeptidase family serine peptidase [Clostridiales bacterium]|nr:prolyl oligopeptidase family serine peptidase [Clostridiales bacterium]
MTRTIDDMTKNIYEYSNGKTHDKMSLPYRTYYPSGYDENDGEKYPLLLFLHGHGECGTDNELHIRVLQKPNELLDRVIKADTCIIVAPQCPCAEEKYEWVNLHHKWGTGSRECPENTPTVALSAAKELLDTFIATKKVDTARIYAAGISMGGYGTWEMITRYPDVFAAAVPVCGGGFPSCAERLKNVSVWAFHGEADGTVPARGTHEMEAAMKALGCDVRATYYEGVGHDSWIPAYKEPELLEWLFSKSK